MKNNIKYLLQRAMGYQAYLYWFSKFKIRTLKQDKKESDFFHFIQDIEKEGAILDIGANIGIMTYHLSQSFKNRTVYAIEPMPDNLTVLKKIISKFKLSNVKVLPFAVGENAEEIEMILPLNGKVKMQGLAHVVHDSIDEWNTGETIKTKSITLNDYFKDIPISAIKMDIENFEFFALKGGYSVLKQNLPIIYLELWDNENRVKCFELLEEIGYKPFIIKNENLVEFNVKLHQHQNFIFKA